jgi:predicted nucleotidyltransferase
VVTNKFDEENSDIDLLVEIEEPDPLEREEMLISFRNKPEAFLKRKVDMLTEASLINPFLRKSIENTKQLIYDGGSQKIYLAEFLDAIRLIEAFTADTPTFD